MLGGSLVILVVGFGFLPKNFGKLAAQSRDIMTSLVGTSQQAATFVKLSQFLSHIAFCGKNFGTCEDLPMGALLENECSLSIIGCGDTRPLLVKKIHFLSLSGRGIQKLWV